MKICIQIDQKVYYSDARHQFFTKLPSLFLRLLLYFRKYSKQDNKRETFPIKDDS